MLLAISLMASAQPRFSQTHGLYDQKSLTVELTTDDGAAEIRYTTDGCHCLKCQTFSARLSLRSA